MLAFKDNWNDPLIPQTWTFGCLTLLIDADETHQKQQDMNLTDNQSRRLNPTDRILFGRLVTKRLERHIGDRLPARVTRVLHKTIALVGPLVTCSECQYPRSVTIMGANGKYGLCLGEYANEKHKEKHVNKGVSKT
ncbi:unnamed protein product [Penicillium egyptiacum]|uniref:Uncharacterized protein n=1 Tax=Penicillium egyptiacum TaxID=1303716 RepID=A0A9W4KKK6_9EURO|nr:unnamed protein product [Penicillium egyptiacum]